MQFVLGNGGGAGIFTIVGGTIGAFATLALVVILFLAAVFMVRRYRRCPSNQILVVYGRTRGQRASKCIHGGGAFVIPIVQDYAYLSLEPMVIEIPLEGALSQNNIRVNVPSTFTVGVSTQPNLMMNAAERLLGLNGSQIRDLVQDIILGQLRLVIATLTIEEINKDRERFMEQIDQNVAQEVNKIGLDLINVNIRDITDESGYIQAIGKRAAAEAINRAKVEVAQQEREGATGESIAVREKTVNVAREQATGIQAQKELEQQQRIRVAALEAEAVKGEVEARQTREVAVAEREAQIAASKKLAEQEQRIRVAEAEAKARTGENTSSATVFESEAKLAEIRAEAKRRADVAAAKALEAIMLAQREQEMARLAKEQIVPQEVEKKRIELAAEAEASRRRIEAKGEADAIFAKYEAEAKGTQKVLEAKAEGYRKLIEACGMHPEVGPTLLLIEQLPQLVAEQVKAIQNLKIDKVTVWDSGGGGVGPDGVSPRNATADWLSGMISALPRIHELANQAGIELPSALGKVGGKNGHVSRAEGIEVVEQGKAE